AEELRLATAERDRAYVLIDGTRALVKMGVLLETKRFLRAPLVSLTPSPDMSVFKTIDIRQDKELAIPIAAPLVHIYPGRGKDSYRLVQKPDGTSTLLIEVPDRFWLTRYLVVSMDK
ncbi:MAG: hypothetical protein ACRD3J_12790, partial [Thermoanaerobaculia bacterium]